MKKNVLLLTLGLCAVIGNAIAIEGKGELHGAPAPTSAQESQVESRAIQEKVTIEKNTELEKAKKAELKEAKTEQTKKLIASKYEELEKISTPEERQTIELKYEDIQAKQAIESLDMLNKLIKQVKLDAEFNKIYARKEYVRAIRKIIAEAQFMSKDLEDHISSLENEIKRAPFNVTASMIQTLKTTKASIDESFAQFAPEKQSLFIRIISWIFCIFHPELNPEQRLIRAQLGRFQDNTQDLILIINSRTTAQGAQELVTAQQKVKNAEKTAATARRSVDKKEAQAKVEEAKNAAVVATENLASSVQQEIVLSNNPAQLSDLAKVAIILTSDPNNPQALAAAVSSGITAENFTQVLSVASSENVQQSQVNLAEVEGIPAPPPMPGEEPVTTEEGIPAPPPMPEPNKIAVNKAQKIIKDTKGQEIQAPTPTPRAVDAARKDLLTQIGKGIPLKKFSEAKTKTTTSLEIGLIIKKKTAVKEAADIVAKKQSAVADAQAFLKKIMSVQEEITANPTKDEYDALTKAKKVKADIEKRKTTTAQQENQKQSDIEQADDDINLAEDALKKAEGKVEVEKRIKKAAVNVETAQAAVSTAQVALETARKSHNNAKAIYDTALKAAGPGAESKVKLAEAQLQQTGERATVLEAIKGGIQLKPVEKPAQLTPKTGTSALEALRKKFEEAQPGETSSSSSDDWEN